MTSHWGTVVKFEIKDPLVVMMCIGEYHDKSQNLIGVGADYKNTVLAFNSTYNYSVFYMNNKNENMYVTEKIDIKTAKLSRRVKIEWTEKEIVSFFKNARDIIVENKHDGLITVISSHGEGQGVILDSNYEEVSLIEIFSTFSSFYCQYLEDKPKIMFIDACRGQMLSKVRPKHQRQNSSTSGDSNSKNNDIPIDHDVPVSLKTKALSPKPQSNIHH